MRHDEMYRDLNNGTEKSFRATFKCAKITSEVLSAVFGLLSSKIENDKEWLNDTMSGKSKNKLSIEELSNNAKGDLMEEDFKIHKSELKDFDKIAQKYDIKFAVTSKDILNEENGKMEKQVTLIFDNATPQKITRAIADFQEEKEKKSKQIPLKEQCKNVIKEVKIFNDNLNQNRKPKENVKTNDRDF